MKQEDLIKITAALRKGEFQIILQHYTDSKKNKKLQYNGCSGVIHNEKPIIYLVEK